MRESNEILADRIRKKVVISGDGGVGKTALLMVQSGQDYKPTIFENYISKVTVGKKTVELSLWDTAGQEDYDRIRPLSYPDTDIMILSYAVCNPDSFYSILDKWFPETTHFLPNTPRILVALKTDLREDKDVLEELSKRNLLPITAEEGRTRAVEIGAIKYFECSARGKDGVKEIFEYVAKISLKPPKNRGQQKCKIL